MGLFRTAEHYMRKQMHYPHTIDVNAYDQMPESGKLTVETFLEHNGIEPETVFLIEIVPGSAKVWTYDRDEDGNFYTDENGELAYSVQTVYDKRIEKRIYYDLDGNTHESLVYAI